MDWYKHDISLLQNNLGALSLLVFYSHMSKGQKEFWEQTDVLGTHLLPYT